MKLENVFNVPVKSYEVSFTYKGFNGFLAVELIDDMKKIYGERALDKLKSIIDQRIRGN